MSFDIIKKLITFRGLFFFIETENIYIHKIIQLLNEKKIDYKVIIKSKKKKFDSKRKNFFYLNKIEFFLLFLLNRDSKKILFVSQPIYAIYYLFLNKFTLIANDCHYGLPNATFVKLFLEKFVIRNLSSIIHRDLRLWKIYKKYLISKKNLLIPDYLNSTDQTIEKTNKVQTSQNIYAAVLGWIDENEVKVTETVIKLLKLGVRVHFYIPDICFKEIKNFSTYIKKYYGDQIEFKKFETHSKMISEISKFHIGICPHSKKNSKINSLYRENCSSSRIIDYIDAELTVLVSKKAFFQRFILNAHNANFFNIFDLDEIQSKEELIAVLKANKREIFVKKKIFKKNYLSSSFEKFMN